MRRPPRPQDDNRDDVEEHRNNDDRDDNDNHHRAVEINSGESNGFDCYLAPVRQHNYLVCGGGDSVVVNGGGADFCERPQCGPGYNDRMVN